MERDDLTKVTGAFLIGGLIGSLIALLYAPQSGRKTRRDISKTAKKVKRETWEVAEETIETIGGFIEDVNEKTSEIISRGKDMTDDMKESIISTIEEGQKTLEKQKARLSKLIR
jgi:gas vesicle protein